MPTTTRRKIGTLTATRTVNRDAMDDPVAFLLKKAEEFRALASRAPELANELRRLAEECEGAAAELREDRRRGARA